MIIANCVRVLVLALMLGVNPEAKVNYVMPISTKITTSIRRESVVYRVPGMDDVTMANVDYDGDLSLDIYYPDGHRKNGARLPAVVFVMGYPDEVFSRWTKSKLKDLGMYISWAQLVAASGMIAVTYETDSPKRDLPSVLRFLRLHGDALGIDGSRIGMWVCSGNTGVAIDALLYDRRTYRKSLKCAVAYYPIVPQFLTQDETYITRFYQKFPVDVPIMIVKAGRESPEVLNELIDGFAEEAEKRQFPLELLSYEEGIHGFDTEQLTPESLEVIVRSLEFMKAQLLK
jgi:hypothetical protein